MKRPAVFFDRDNTLIVSDGYLGDPAGVVLVDGAADAVARARSLGFAVVVFSNQSGIARGMFTEEDAHRVNARVDELLLDQNPQAVIDRHEFCPFHPDGTVEAYAKESDLRKPKPGMIYQAADKLALDLGRSWVVGDAPRDIESGKAAGCKTIWYKDPKLPPSMAARELMLTVPDAVVATLKEAMDVIAREALMRQPLADNGPTPAQTASRAMPPPPPPPLPATVTLPVEPELPDEDAEPTIGVAPPPEPQAPARRAAGAGPRSVASAKPLMQVLAEKRAAAASAAADAQQAVAGASPATSTARLEELAEQILQELQNRRDKVEPEFSISKLLAGIMQIVAIAVPLLAYFIYHSSTDVAIELGIFLQAFTIALLIMGRQR